MIDRNSRFFFWLVFVVIISTIAFPSWAEESESTDSTHNNPSGELKTWTITFWGLASGDLKKETIESLNRRIIRQFENSGKVTLFTKDDLSETLSLKALEEGSSCEKDRGCMTNLSSLGSKLLLNGNVAKIGDKWLLTASVFDTSKVEIVGRVSRETVEKNLESTVDAVVKEILSTIEGSIQSEKQTIDLSALGDHPSFAVFDLKAHGVPESLAKNLTNVVALELKQFQDVTVISREEIKAALQFEADKQSLGCDSVSCFSEIGNAMGVQYLMTGSVGKLKDTHILNLQVIDIRETAIIGRASEFFMGPEDGLLAATRFVLRDLFGVPTEGQGFFKMTANVDNVELILNGKNLGLWPKVVPDEHQIAGKLQIMARKEGYRTLSQETYIEPGRLTSISLNLIKEPTPWWKTWWFWTIAGTVVAGGVTTGVILGTSDSKQPSSGSGTATLPGVSP